MKHRIVAYAAGPVLALGLLGVNLASAHGLYGSIGLTPDQIVARQQLIFQQEASILGVNVDVVKEAWAQGKSLWQVAQERGMTKEQLQEKLKNAKATQASMEIQALVKAGVITQAQADARLKALQTNKGPANKKFKGRFGGKFHGKGRMMGRF
jgi:hypothetical protein